MPDSLHDFVANYIRYSTQVGAYVFLAANPYPWFRVQQDYPVDVEIDPPVRQGRWGGFFRLLLAVPALAARDGARRRLGHRLVGSELGGVVERRTRRRSGSTRRRSAASQQPLPSSRGSRSSRAEAPRAGCAT